jgi:hypothetical protein
MACVCCVCVGGRSIDETCIILSRDVALYWKKAREPLQFPPLTMTSLTHTHSQRRERERDGGREREREKKERLRTVVRESYCWHRVKPSSPHYSMCSKTRSRSLFELPMPTLMPIIQIERRLIDGLTD